MNEGLSRSATWDELTRRSSLIPAVFAFLDAVLTEAEKGGVMEIDPEIGERRWPPGLREKVSDQINGNFRLQYWGCPLRKELADFRLFYRDDMADALAIGYSRNLRGEDPIAALNADYSVKDFGILKWEDLDDLRCRARQEDSLAASTWGDFARFYEDGDRLVKYRSPTASGYLLVRGDRLVWPREEFRYLVLGPSLRGQAERDKFRELGGSRGFLNGHFEWPPPNWVNPVTIEEEAAAIEASRGELGRRLRVETERNG